MCKPYSGKDRIIDAKLPRLLGLLHMFVLGKRVLIIYNILYILYIIKHLYIPADTEKYPHEG